MAFGIGLIHYDKELERRDETISQLGERIKELEAEIEQLKRLLADKATSKASKKPKFTENYSLDKNTHKTRHHAGSTGRRSHEAKRDLISPACRQAGTLSPSIGRTPTRSSEFVIASNLPGDW